MSHQLNQLKSQFISTASHEFQTPLTAISSSTELAKLYLAREASTPTSLIAKHLDVIVAKVAALNELISDTLTISKIEVGKLTLWREPTDVVALCGQLIASRFGEQPDGRALDWEVRGQPALVSLDKKLINHVLTNLIGNAFKFSTTNPGLQIRFEGGVLELAVRDEGIGIPSADVPQLFSKFYRAGNASGFPGTGLGLVIC